MTIKVIIFDFDGTIADSRDAFIKVANRLAGEFGYQPVDREEIEKLKDLSSQEIVRKAEVPLIKIPFILGRIKEELSKDVKSLKTFSGLKSCLETLKDRGYILGIVTSNNKSNVITFLENNELANRFNFIYSGTPLFGKHKIINHLIRQNRFQLDEVIYVGDETRDINAAKKSKIKIIAVSWGFNSTAILSKYQPDFLIDKPQELLDILNH